MRRTVHRPPARTPMRNFRRNRRRAIGCCVIRARTRREVRANTNEQVQEFRPPRPRPTRACAPRKSVGVLKSQRQQAVAQLESAKAQVNTAQQNLDDTVLKASVDGTIGDSSARIGQYVQPGTRLMSVVPVQAVVSGCELQGNTDQAHASGPKGQIENRRHCGDGDRCPSRELRARAPGRSSPCYRPKTPRATSSRSSSACRVRLRVLAPKELVDRLLPGLSVKVSVNTADRDHAT